MSSFGLPMYRYLFLTKTCLSSPRLPYRPRVTFVQWITQIYEDSNWTLAITRQIPVLDNCQLAWTTSGLLLTAGAKLCVWDVDALCNSLVSDPAAMFDLPVHPSQIRLSSDDKYLAILSGEKMPLLRIVQLNYTANEEALHSSYWTLQYHMIILDSPAVHFSWKPAPQTCAGDRSNSAIVTTLNGQHYIVTEMPKYGRNGCIDRFATKFIHSNSSLCGSLAWWSLDDKSRVFFNPSDKLDPYIWDLGAFPGGVNSITYIESSLTICGLGKKIAKSSIIEVSPLTTPGMFLIADTCTSTPSVMVLKSSFLPESSEARHRFELVGALHSIGILKPERILLSKSGNFACLIDASCQASICEVKNNILATYPDVDISNHRVMFPRNGYGPILCVENNLVFCSSNAICSIDPFDRSHSAVHVSHGLHSSLICLSNGCLINTDIEALATVVLKDIIYVMKSNKACDSFKYTAANDSTCITAIQTTHKSSIVTMICGVLDQNCAGIVVFGSNTVSNGDILESVSAATDGIQPLSVGPFGDILSYHSSLNCLQILSLSILEHSGTYKTFMIDCGGKAPLAHTWSRTDCVLYIAFSDGCDSFGIVFTENNTVEWILRSRTVWPLYISNTIASGGMVDISVTLEEKLWLVVNSCIFCIDQNDVTETWTQVINNPERTARSRLLSEINMAALLDFFVPSNSDTSPKLHDSNLEVPHKQTVVSSPKQNAFSFFDVDLDNIILNSSQSDLCVSTLSTEVNQLHSSSFDFDSEPQATNALPADSSKPAGLDASGAKFLSFMRLRQWGSCRSLDFGGFEYVAARMSDAQEVLISTCISEAGALLSYANFMFCGFGFWVNNIARLRELLETMAKSDFAKTQDPHLCTFIFILIGRFTGVGLLWRSTSPRIASFLSSDFTRPDVRAIALKNAFAALSKQDNLLAAVFFMLADAPFDAIQACIDKLGDPHLAFLITRFKLSSTDKQVGAQLTNLLKAEHASVPPMVVVLARKLFDEAIDIVQIYEEEEPTLPYKSDLALCIPLALISIRKTEMSQRRVMNCIRSLCKIGCLDVALKVAETYSCHICPSVEIILRIQNRLLYIA